ncbi:cytoplasmic chaperone TorD family protein [Ferrimonas balearica DSM 9799]|uniref:Chaperone protein TorD n=1 Tax=Ferrimonas balearica (strain DSM 9799 / CCM 4581 / KCTC 23876 / PAT) TaxID=550540 RepID=TORD_FERBD|nr:molecular chaperone TorD [Ferrimonas balearica]E1SVR5.1 RecName: Full=Chaperone protein TorD [Ferrimonas balearica DSM 9799]ADN76396.1 cytoplasmic chaperone TorD family protein [Ferrimonas balearica DSM 9799]
MDEQEIREEVALAERRATLYWWFASMLCRELDSDQLNTLCSESGRVLLDALAEEPSLAPGCQKLRRALAGVQVLATPQLELAADYATAFLGDHLGSAPPYASVYVEPGGMMFQHPHQQMVQWLQQWQLAVSFDGNEPADHFAIMLDLMGNLVLKGVDSPEAQSAQSALLAEMLPPMRRWVTQCQRQPGFYAALAELLLAFVSLDQTLIEGEFSLAQ